MFRWLLEHCMVSCMSLVCVIGPPFSLFQWRLINRQTLCKGLNVVPSTINQGFPNSVTARITMVDTHHQCGNQVGLALVIVNIHLSTLAMASALRRHFSTIIACKTAYLNFIRTERPLSIHNLWRFDDLWSMIDDMFEKYSDTDLVIKWTEYRSP